MQSRHATTRGRPRGRSHSIVEMRILEYLTKVSVKHRIDPDQFFDKIVDAWKNGLSKCEQITIQCRQKKRHQAIFLLTMEHQVIAQLPISDQILKRTAPLKEIARARVRSKTQA